MNPDLEKELLNELTVLYGRECAVAMLTFEKRKAGEDVRKLLASIRHVLAMVGGENYAELIYERLQTKVGAVE
jgi:hypothetical protein